MKAWRCEFCGVVHKALTRFKKVATEIAEVAETYLEENPEEE
jgi:AhpD family alkylhydroperoxidase